VKMSSTSINLRSIRIYIRIYILILVLSFFWLAPMGCSSSKQAQKPEAKPTGSGSPVVMTDQEEQIANLGLNVARSYEPKGIVIGYKADKTLNFYDGSSHSLMLAVYQLDSINAFNELAKDLDGVNKLLSLSKFDKSVLGYDRYFVEPAETNQIEIDRLEGAKWLAIVAGYYELIPAQAIRTYEIPINIEKKGMYGFRKTEAKVSKLIVNLFLGSNSIQEIRNP